MRYDNKNDFTPATKVVSLVFTFAGDLEIIRCKLATNNKASNSILNKLLLKTNEGSYYEADFGFSIYGEEQHTTLLSKQRVLIAELSIAIHKITFPFGKEMYLLHCLDQNVCYVVNQINQIVSYLSGTNISEDDLFNFLMKM